MTRGPVFLERRTYARRRLADAARLLPLAGLFAVLLPGLFGAGTRTSSTLLYLLGVWALLIAVAAILSPRLAREGDDP